jgi:hypothetical protein
VVENFELMMPEEKGKDVPAEDSEMTQEEEEGCSKPNEARLP